MGREERAEPLPQPGCDMGGKPDSFSSPEHEKRSSGMRFRMSACEHERPGNPQF